MAVASGPTMFTFINGESTETIIYDVLVSKDVGHKWSFTGSLGTFELSVINKIDTRFMILMLDITVPDKKKKTEFILIRIADLDDQNVSSTLMVLGPNARDVTPLGTTAYPSETFGFTWDIKQYQFGQ